MAPTFQKTHQTEAAGLRLPHLSRATNDRLATPRILGGSNIAVVFVFTKRPPDLVSLHIPDLPQKSENNKVMGARQGFWGVCLKGKTFHGFFDALGFFSLPNLHNIAGGAVMGQFPELCYSSLLQPFVDKTGMAASWPV